MQRNLQQLAQQPFDVLVIGGGASGAATARESSLRGLRTALIEREDFGAGASAHCFKVVHGGIRYLQHGDVRRLRASCHERSAFLRIAPHLVSPLPFVIPTYGHGRGSKWFLGTGMRIYDTLSADRNRGIRDRSRRVPGTRFLSRGRTLELFPFIDPERLTGAAIFDDGQMYSPPRLVLALAAAAQARGAAVANYASAQRLLVEQQRVVGVLARDELEGESFEIRARLVINAAGPWAEGVLAGLPAALAPDARSSSGSYSRDACFVIDRRPGPPMALALPGRTRDADALVARATRHLFLVPWRDKTLVGVWHKVVPRDPDAVGLDADELDGFIDEINSGCPGLGLNRNEVTMAGFGLVPFGEAAHQGEASLSFGKESRLIDHESAQRLPGLITLISVRYTVARKDAAAALDLGCRKLGIQARSRAGTHESLSAPVPGGDIEDFEEFLRRCRQESPDWLPAASIEALARNHGRLTAQVLALARHDPGLQGVLPGSHVTLAEVAYAVREEMAQKMTDIVFRRTDLGTAGDPGRPALDALEQFLSAHCGWSERRLRTDRAAVEAHLRRYLPMRADSDTPQRRVARQA